MAKFSDLTSYGLVISPRVCIVNDKVVETTSCIIWTVLLIFTVQLTILHLAVIIADKVTQLLTPCFLRLVRRTCAGLEECCDTQNWKWLAWLFNLIAKICTTKEDRKRQKELIKHMDALMSKIESYGQRYDYLVETLGCLKKLARNEILTAEQVQTTCNLDFEMSGLPNVVAQTITSLRLMGHHHRYGAWILAFQRASNPLLRTSGLHKRLGRCCGCDCGCSYEKPDVSSIKRASLHCDKSRMC